MKRSDFGPDFVWGTATASYQIEGAWQADGKSPSIWDSFSHTAGKIKTAETGDRACEFYTRYEEDLDLMRSLHLPHFRFSTAWTRILPDGHGRVNQAGIDYYNRLIDACLTRGIEPWLTAYHWDLPQVLQDRGGWKKRSILEPFEEYLSVLARYFGDRVKNWMVFNEPMAFTGLGYFAGVHAPGLWGPWNFFPAVAHVALAQGRGGRLLKNLLPQAQIGTTFSNSWIDPASDGWLDQQAALRLHAVMNRLYLEPLLGLGFPNDDVWLKPWIDFHLKSGDEKDMVFDYDFIGVQLYTREKARFSALTPLVWADIHKASLRGVKHTEMDWEVYPQAIYNILKFYHSYGKIKKIIVTENGAAFPDSVVNGRVHDADRTAYLKEYMGQILRARQEGVPVEGYMIWSFMDNFEWAEGFRPRFGLVHVDFDSQKRTVKDSGLWFSDFLSGRNANV
ncbi:MAG: beta-glucosidase [Spirochaetales bacterium]|nr:beta-glucosidase [Spirochaetales bacterium]